jgi:hypothetical protein
MAQPAALSWGLALLDHDAPHLAVILYQGSTRPYRLRTTDSTLERIHHVLEPIVHVVCLQCAARQV